MSRCLAATLVTWARSWSGGCALAWLALCAPAMAQESDGPQSKMLGAQPVRIHNYPWQVSIASDGAGGHFCGGVLIHTHWVLTAAHCLGDLRDGTLRVRAGDEHLDGALGNARVRLTVRHPSYEPATWRNDIALLKIDPLPVGTQATPVQGPDAAVAARLGDTDVMATGWGVNRPKGSLPSNELLGARFRVVPTATCNRAPGFAGRVTESMLCLAGEGHGESICNGDSGGPAVMFLDGYARLVGIASVGLTDCTGRLVYSVFTRVDRYASWVRETTRGQVDWR